ncbi:uncharacterized protein LOC125240514 [Leguminivora glycinivorella]|uniref:uncharacterized protein LOC125240514 n=1 Tax=Leguminivora glycinivorella TaxID=1035111 RepID=UPI0020104582|nr:uncharacterized protein LOC125240514 [Leguminivora glycinivorella]
MRRRKLATKVESHLIEELEEKIRRLERKIEERSRSRSASPRRHGGYGRPRYFTRSSSRSETYSRSASYSRSPSPPAASRSRSRSPLIVIETRDDLPGDLGAAIEASKIENGGKEGGTTASEELSEEIVALLGEAPEKIVFSPNLLEQLASRWQDIIKKGLNKEERDKLIKKYPVPENCKVIGAPKMNLEAQSAAGDTLVNRDKAIEQKQTEVSCALTAIGLALNKLCVAGNEEIITLLSDSGRLLCDYQHRESQLRKMFITSGLDNKTARETLKDCDVDQWLFGENLAEKLKASKAIEQKDPRKQRII